jgi:DNA-binding beta-propeller fold protein YncE
VDRRRFLAAAATVPFAIRAGTAMAGGTAVALVTADTESRVVAVDLLSGRVVRSIPTLPGPRSIEAVGGRTALVCHTGVAAVSMLDTARLHVTRVLREFSEPRYVAAHPNGRYAYVTDSASSEVVAVDVVAGRTLGRVRVGGWARHVTIDAAGRTLWVGLGTAEERLAVVDVRDPVRPRLVRHVRAGFGAHDVGFLPGARAVWVTSGDRGAMEVRDARTREVLARIRADTPPQHVAFGRRVAYVTSGADGTLRVHALDDGRLIHATRVDVGSYNVQRGWGRILTPSLDRGTLTVLTERGRLARSVRAASSCHDACFVMAA